MLRPSLVQQVLAFCMVLMCASTVFGQADIDITVSLSRDTIGLDEQAVMQIVVSSNVDALPRPKMPTLPMFEVYSQGQSSNYSIINGKVDASVTYRYLVMPQKPGIYPIENIAIVHQNRRYVGNPVTLTVLDKGSTVPAELEDRAQDSRGESKDYFLEAVVDNQNPYVNEQVTFTLKFYIAVQFYGSPRLSEPTTTGFWTELLGSKAPYRQRVNNRTYRVIERKYALFPTQTGELTIGKAIITATVASKRRQRNVFGIFGGGEEIQARSAPLSIKVRPLPQSGRPSDYTGTIGKFRISAQVNKTVVELNQPVTLTVNISGVGNIKSVAEPQIPELEDFRVYKASSSENISKINDKIGGTKTFEEVFIPERPGTLQIPALSLSYFDPERQRYRTISTSPISIKVSRPEGYTDIEGLPYNGPNMTIGAEARDIRFIKKDLGELQPKGRLIAAAPLYVTVNAVSVLLLAVMVAFRVRREKLSADIGYARSRGAAKQARKRLVRARELAGTDHAAEFYAECSQAVLSYMADKLNVSPHGLTSDMIAEYLSERGADQQLIDDTVQFLNKCGFARYAPGVADQGEIDQALRTAQDLMVRIEGVKF